MFIPYTGNNYKLVISDFSGELLKIGDIVESGANNLLTGFKLKIFNVN
jgi:hypothetical protein